VLTTAGKRKVTLVLEAELGDRLERLCLLRNQSLNKLCAELIVAGEGLVHEAARADAVGALRAELRAGQRDLEGTVYAEVRKMSGRLAGLLARTALEATAARSLQLRTLSLEYQKDEVERLKEGSWKSAVSSLKSPGPAVREGLDALVAGVDLVGSEALPRALGVVEGLVSRLEGNLVKFGEGVERRLGGVTAEVNAMQRQVSSLTAELAGMRNDLSKRRGLFG
jgi:hypothetical protein